MSRLDPIRAIRAEFLGLPHQVRQVYVGVALSTLGSGLTVPFLYVYLSQMRGVPTIGVGLLLGAMGAVTLVVVPVVGTLIDRFGPRAVAIGGQLAMVVAVAVLAVADSLPRIVAALALLTSGHAATHPATIVLAQLVALRYVEGRRRSSMLSLTGAVWAVSWAVVAAAAVVPGSAAAACIVGGLALFGLGETVLSPTAPALVNDLATEELRGRYNALAGLT